MANKISIPMPRPRQMAFPAARTTKPRPDKVVWYAFLILSIICFWNLNGISYLVFKQGQIFSIGILICGLIILARAGIHFTSELTPPMIAYLVFMTAYIGVGAIGNPDPKYVITYVNAIFIVVASAVATRALVPRIGLGRFLGTTAFLLCLGAWTVFLSPYLSKYYASSGVAEMSSNVGRFIGFFTNPNDAGMNADLAAVACFACLTLARKKSIALIAAISITGLAAVLTFSRSALLTLAGVGLGYLALTTRFKRRAIGMIIAGIILLGVSYWFFTQGYHLFKWTPQQSRRIQSMEKIMTFQEVDDSDTGGRLIGAAGGLKYWLKRPWIGHGLGTLHAMPDKYFGGLGCHNMHVTVLGEAGLFCGLPYLLFLLIWAWHAWMCRQPTVRAFSLALVFVYLFFGMVSHGILDQRSMNMMMGICFGLLSVENVLLKSEGREQPVGYHERRLAPNHWQRG